MKLRNKLIATIVSISMILAVIGVGAWASTESFTASITNTVNLEFDNLKGQIAVQAMSGADNLDAADEPYMQAILYDGSNVIYNQISSNATNGTNLYWEGTRFLDTSEDGMQVVDNETEAAVFGYLFQYSPTEACTGMSTITAMITETALPEIAGGKLMVKYFATTDMLSCTEIGSGEAITPIRDNEMLVVVAVCQYYNLERESISSIATAWDFNVTFTAGRNEKTALPGGARISTDPSDGIVLAFDYDDATLAIRSTANLECDNLKGSVGLIAGSGANNLQSSPPVIQEQILYDGANVVYDQISSNPTSGTNLYWEGTKFFDNSGTGLRIVNEDTEAAVLLYGFGYIPTEECTGANTITVMVNEINAPEIDGGLLVARYFVTADPDLDNWWPIVAGEPVTLTRDNQAVSVMAVCQYYATDEDQITTQGGQWDFQVSFSAGQNEVIELGAEGFLYIDVFDFADGIILPEVLIMIGESQIDPRYSDTIWELVEMGEYPQTLKADNVTITSATPDADGYYTGSDGARYAKLKADGNDMTPSGVQLVQGTEYYFKVEPIKWRVLKSEDGTDFVVADRILDRSEYQDDSYDGGGMIYYEVIIEEEDWGSVPPTDGYYDEYDTSDPDHPDFEVPITTRDESYYAPANDYNHSDLKVFVEQTFYNKAFSSSEKAQMESLSAGVGRDGYNNADYKLSNVGWAPTDYAVAVGVDWVSLEWYVENYGTAIGLAVPLYVSYMGCGECWLGSSNGNGLGTNCADVVCSDKVDMDPGMYDTVEQSYGVVPAMYITREN